MLPQPEPQPQPPLVVHLVHRFDTGGLENGIVNLINHMPPDRYRHAVLALTDVTDFRHRIRRDGVLFHALHKPPGQGVWQYPAVVRLLRAWRPAVVHTRNLGTLEFQLPAFVAGVTARVHGEHGRDVGDLDGSNRRNRLLRRLYQPFVQHWLALSRDLADDLVQRVGVPLARVTQVCNGVDVDRFSPPPAPGRRAPIAGCPFGADAWLLGTVGRMQPVKDQTLLAHAFVRALALAPHLRARLRLVMVGEGPLRAASQAILADAGVADLAWLPGERSDVADVMRGLDCFVLPSLAEGISNTILEAMASGLPVIATAVGGSPDLVDAGRSGELVPAGDVQALAGAVVQLAADPARAAAMGAQGRLLAEQRFGLQAMVATYQRVYDRLLQRPQARPLPAAP